MLESYARELSELGAISDGEFSHIHLVACLYYEFVRCSFTMCLDSRAAGPLTRGYARACSTYHKSNCLLVPAGLPRGIKKHVLSLFNILAQDGQAYSNYN